MELINMKGEGLGFLNGPPRVNKKGLGEICIKRIKDVSSSVLLKI
jgi:hypothetical protein